ncbi:hypothetical protein pipiens_013869 [Culex pipiens pipiens]|uniref:Uncharacterized protein n=1 Tax=Culex pipiens pipiens TaxID=38569 RepID=A0ABD1CXC6_CULPP
MFIVSVLLLIAVSTGQDFDPQCDLLVIYPNSSQPSPLNSSGCNFPIEERYNWTLLDVQLPPPDSSNPEWKDMFRAFDNQSACLRFPVGYTVNQHVGLYYLEIGVECRGEPRTNEFTFEPMLWMQGEEEFINARYNDGRYSLNRDCLNFGMHQFKLNVGTSLQIIQQSSAGFITLGAPVNDSSQATDICNCTEIKAFEVLLKKCISEPFVDSSLEKLNVTNRKTHDLHAIDATPINLCRGR